MRRFSIAAACAAFLLAFIDLVSFTAMAATTDFKQPHAYAVVIGISQYREEGMAKIPYAARDAEAIAQVLEVQGGIPKTHIKLLTESKATHTDIRNHVNDWLKMRVKPDSTVYIYYAGHGTPNPQTGEVYLVPWEGNPDFPSGLYPVKDLYASLNRLPAKEIIVMLDSCFSGAPGRSVLPKGTRPMVITLENPLLAGGKITVLSASTGSQMSSDYEKTGHGLFTHYLLAGLGGAADKDKNHLVTLRELYPYVREHVSETAVEELNREQTPMLLPGEDVLGVRATQPLVHVVPGFVPSIKTQPAAKPDAPIQEARARPYETPTQAEIAGKDGAPMVLVPAGDFLYYTSRRSLPAYYMDKYEVTTRLYWAFLQAARREYPIRWNEITQESDWNRPVIGVTWHDADAYCRYYEKRLPTDAQYAKAAAGVEGRRYPWGDEQPSSQHANFGKAYSDWRGYATLATVGSYEDGKSAYGLYDMSGNVWEWTGSGNEDKNIHGGGWADSSWAMASTTSNTRSPSHRSYDLGFRCAQDAPK